jgi:hypothetical protein
MPLMPFSPVQKTDAMDPAQGIPFSKLAAEVTTMLPICAGALPAVTTIARIIVTVRIFEYLNSWGRKAAATLPACRAKNASSLRSPCPACNLDLAG